MLRKCDVILQAVGKLKMWVTAGSLPGWGWVGYVLKEVEGEGAGSVLTCGTQKQTIHILLLLWHKLKSGQCLFIYWHFAGFLKEPISKIFVNICIDGNLLLILNKILTDPALSIIFSSLEN